MSTRPHLSKSISDLENLFDTHRTNEKICAELLYELKFRKTTRAIKLQKQLSIPTFSQAESKATYNSQKVENNEITTSDLFDFAPSKTSETQETSPEASKSKPPITNHPNNVLKAWTALEVLSPQGYKRETDLTGGQKHRVAWLNNSRLPWEVGEKSIPKKKLFYELILGAITLEPAVNKLLKVYSDNRPDSLSTKGKSPLATILLDKDGRPLEEDTTCAVSSFAWGVPVALKGDLSLLAEWTSQQRVLTKSLHKYAIRKDNNGQTFPLTKAVITDLFDHLCQTLNLRDHDVEAPSFAIRRYEFFASKKPPEPSLLNSFYLEDLAKARSLEEAGNLPKALNFYLGVRSPQTRINLLEDNANLQNLLQPALTPIGRWPGKGRHPLAILQQAAVNATSKSINDTGILAVNGPPAPERQHYFETLYRPG